MPITLITETNVPYEENVSYFEEGNEAHLVYQFSLAPLLLFSYLTGEAQALVNWTPDLAPPPKGCSYFNFIASHDGIGLRPLEGLLPEAEIGRLIDIVHDRGGFASVRSTQAGENVPTSSTSRCFPRRDVKHRRLCWGPSIVDGLPRRTRFVFERLAGPDQ